MSRVQKSAYILKLKRTIDNYLSALSELDLAARLPEGYPHREERIERSSEMLDSTAETVLMQCSITTTWYNDSKLITDEETV